MSSGNTCELRFNLVNLPSQKEETTDHVPTPAFFLSSSDSNDGSLPVVHYVSEHDYSMPPVHTFVDSSLAQSPPCPTSHTMSSQVSNVSTVYQAEQSVYTQHCIAAGGNVVTAPSPHMFAHSPLPMDSPSPLVYASEESNDGMVQCAAAPERMDTSSQQCQKKTIHRYIIVQPGEDGEKATADAINNIAESLNREAAARIARGQVPDEETVIEVTRIQSPADGYFSREQFMKNRISRPVPQHASALSSASNRLDLDHRTPEKALVGSIGGHHQPPASSQSQSVKYSNSKDLRWYRTPTPPRVGEPGYIDSSDSLNDSCYFNGASRKGFTYRTQHHSTAPCTQTASSLLAASSHREDSNNQHIDDPQTDSDETKKLNDSLTNMQWLEAMSNKNSNSKPQLSGQLQNSIIFTKGVPKQTGSHRDSRLLATDKQIEKISRECGRKKRPPFSYMHLIQMAICSKEDRKLTLKQIYQWIEEKFPYYKHHPSQGWRNSIRHNLSLYDIFVREKPNVPGQTGCSYWTLRSDVDPKPSSKLKHSAFLADSSDMAPSSPACLPQQQPPVVVMPPLGGFEPQVEQLNVQASKCNKKGPVPLLPKPGPVQAYALIPIQGGVPVIPSQPMLVQSTVGVDGKSNSSLNNTYSSLDGSLSKDPLKRNRSPSHGVVGPPKKKLPKLLAKPNILSGRSKPRADSNNSIMSTDSGVSFSKSNCSLSLSQSHSQSSFLSKHDSGIESRSLSRSLSDSSSNSTETPEGPKGLPKPKMYNRRKSKLVPKFMQEETRSPAFSACVSEVVQYRGAEQVQNVPVSDCGIHEILASIEQDLSSPIRNLLKTPPKDSAKNLLTSTPFGGALGSPSWLSPIKLLTPLTGDANKDTCVITPASAISSAGKVATSTPYRLEGTPSPSYFTRIKNSTPIGLDASPQLREFTPSKLITGSPLCFKSSTEKSPRAGSLRSLGMPGLTPLKSPSHAVNCHSPNASFSMTNQSFTRLFGEFHLDSMLDDGINMDVGNFSFSALQ